ncbi:RagB/SusD family nutrient uptake outer membrane protein [Salmonirosea aquatica]|uniref:RagB/SusD family nutrient uptake outer membrane protein n=1 Tax=Salmonirosea aquatica TaxID=2654236 RepID=A0A7C9BDP5_9BACT|nr:RagB/SusD family nutrient uptake outer membrane protein [Cytophagaceae bacterium SJW1-29]
MKNRAVKYFLISLVGTLFLGCTDLEEDPVGILAPESLFKTPKDVQTAIFGAYGWIASERLYGRQFVTALLLRGDMADIGDRGTPAERQQVNDFNMDDNNNMVRQFWPYWYQTISAVNAAISGAEGLGLPENEGNPLIAEARFVRAFSYYHLVRTFGDIPYLDRFITDPTSVKDISKTSAATVYQNIIADLQFAKQWLPDQQPNSVRSRPSKGTAAAYLASVYLTLADYQKSYAEAKFVIDNEAKFGYGLVADFQDLFRAPEPNNLKEHLFAIDFLGQQNGGGGANDDIMPPMTGVRGADAPRSGWSVAVPSMAVYNTWDSRDYRKQVSFTDSILIKGILQPYTVFDNTKRPHIAKYARYAGNSNTEGRYSDHNYAAMRYAEVLLIAAEALTEVNGGPNAEAIGYINQIRSRARNWAGKQTSFPEDVNSGLSKDAFINLVLEERRLELAFEYKRWYDIKRRKLGQAAFTGPNSLEPHPNFDPNRDYLMPLPRIELQVNPNLGPQNPGY